MRKALTLLLATLLVAGCGIIYRQPVFQGNLLESKNVEQLKAGMTLAIEPMITDGSYEIHIDDDGWSIFTVDDSLAAHFEHTVAITEEGPRVLTLAHGDSIVNRPI